MNVHLQDASYEYYIPDSHNKGGIHLCTTPVLNTNQMRLNMPDEDSDKKSVNLDDRPNGKSKYIQKSLLFYTGNYAPKITFLS